MRKTLQTVVVLIAAAAVYYFSPQEAGNTAPSSQQRGEQGADHRGQQRGERRDASSIQTVHDQRQSGVMLTVERAVLKVLPDDTKGSRHQRFLIKGGNDFTVLVAHNIDLAPRVAGLREGDLVTVHGQYEWNEKGGVLHWTHHDPRNNRPGGWIEHDGERYR